MKKIIFGIIFAIVGIILYLHFKGPNLVISTTKNSVVINSVFLGDYHLGFSKIRIIQYKNNALVCELIHRHYFRADDAIIQLKYGTNTEASIFGSAPQDGLQKNCILNQQKYIVEVWGNNGFANQTKATTLIDLNKVSKRDSVWIQIKIIYPKMIKTIHPI